MTYRTHTCGELRDKHISEVITLSGWVNNYRDHGGVRFIDLRDREGITQVVFHPEHEDAHALAHKMRREDVIKVTGECIIRSGGENPKLATGKIEVNVTDAEVLADSANPPFLPDEAHKVGEEVRLRYRYIDLRTQRLQNTLKTRHQVAKAARDYFDSQGFYEVETPFLCKSTPEGARDFLVPSRNQQGEFYALPQSPQIFKQICMVAGLDKYFQIARCFRDEDPRADRQAEFTQIDVEMSFVTQEDIIKTNEGLIRHIWKTVLDQEIGDIPHMTYAEAMERFGSDRPDMRFGMELTDITELAATTDFKVFSNAIENGGCVKAICVPGGGAMTRKQTDGLAEWVKQFGAGGLPVTKVVDGGLASGVAKFVEPIAQDIIKATGAKDGDLICIGVDSKRATVLRVLGELRCKIAKDLDLIPADAWKWVWIVDFPAFEWVEDAQRWHCLHHPFTRPTIEDLDKLDSTDHDVIAGINSNAYDLVLNGSELGGGSVRIHRQEEQAKVFKLLGLSEEEAKEKFGFLLEALSFGAPPHAGIAFGLDRLVMHLCGTENIRDVIPFPKTQAGADLMTQAPSSVADAQLKELHLRTVQKIKPVAVAAGQD